MNTQTLTVDTHNNPYNIYVGEGLLDEAAGLIDAERYPHVVIITDSNVGPLYARHVATSFAVAGCKTSVVQFPAGEDHKNLSELGHILEKVTLTDQNRHDLFVGLGGGVTLDMCGLCASLWMRGCDYIQIPTTLLAMVDASIGGKTAVDLPQGKNLIGTFWQPKAVICDVETLSTCTDDVFYDGVAEVIKHAIIGSPALFETLEQKPLLPGSYSNKDLVDIIMKNVAIKAYVVMQDPNEQGLRKVLNFGHTIGHAIEALSSYTLGHGQCISIGMNCILNAQSRLGLYDRSLAKRADQLLKAHHLPTTTSYSETDILDMAWHDKKRKADVIQEVFIKSIGEPLIKDLIKQQLKMVIELGLPSRIHA